MTKVITRPRKTATPVAAPETPVADQAHQSLTRFQAPAQLSPVTSSNQEQQSQPAFPRRAGLLKALPFGEVDRFTRELHRVDAVLSMINRIMCEDVELSGQLKLVDGLMGSVQYAHRTLGGLSDIICESDWDEVPDLYWGVFQAYSLVSLLERMEFDDGFEWRGSKSTYFDFISAATSSIDMALVVLEGGVA